MSSHLLGLGMQEKCVNRDLLLAFRFFDRSCCGYMHVEDLRRVLQCASLGLTSKEVHKLVLEASDQSDAIMSRKGDRIYYTNLCFVSSADGQPILARGAAS